MILHREVLPPRERLTREDYERTHYAIQKARRQKANERAAGLVLAAGGVVIALYVYMLRWWL